jgi:hypothetical protein
LKIKKIAVKLTKANETLSNLATFGHPRSISYCLRERRRISNTQNTTQLLHMVQANLLLSHLTYISETRQGQTQQNFIHELSQITTHFVQFFHLYSSQVRLTEDSKGQNDTLSPVLDDLPTSMTKFPSEINRTADNSPGKHAASVCPESIYPATQKASHNFATLRTMDVFPENEHSFPLPFLSAQSLVHVVGICASLRTTKLHSVMGTNFQQWGLTEIQRQRLGFSDND